jgi:DNA N-6-adenine-methyltransferase (Dam)
MSDTTRIFPRVLFSSISQDWRTPPDIYAGLDAEFHFTLDPCPNGGTDGLRRSWAGERIFCNPPYRRGEIARWLAKAREAECAVYLLPVRTSPAWWHEYALKADEIRFFTKRMRFSGATSNAPFDSCLVIYR